MAKNYKDAEYLVRIVNLIPGCENFGINETNRIIEHYMERLSKNKKKQVHMMFDLADKLPTKKQKDNEKAAAFEIIVQDMGILK